MLQSIKIDWRAFTVLSEMMHVSVLREECGFLLGCYEGEIAVVKRACYVTNAASWSGGFAISDYEQRRVERVARMYRLELFGVYHTHPGGHGRLSIQDLCSLRYSELFWMVIYQEPRSALPKMQMAVYAPPSGTPIPVEITQE